MHGFRAVEIQDAEDFRRVSAGGDSAQRKTSQRAELQRHDALLGRQRAVEPFDHEQGLAAFDDLGHGRLTGPESRFVQTHALSVASRGESETFSFFEDDKAALRAADADGRLQDVIERAFGSERLDPLLLEIENAQNLLEVRRRRREIPSQAAHRLPDDPGAGREVLGFAFSSLGEVGKTSGVLAEGDMVAVRQRMTFDPLAVDERAVAAFEVDQLVRITSFDELGLTARNPGIRDQEVGISLAADRNLRRRQRKRVDVALRRSPLETRAFGNSLMIRTGLHG